MTDILNRKNQINDAFESNYANIEIMKDYLQKNIPEFHKNFELLNYIKTGTTGILYKVKAKNIRNKQYYALKFCEQKNGPYKYIQEIILHKKLHHNNINKLFGIYKVKDNIDANISPTLRHSIFRDNNIRNMNLPDFFDYIVEYIESLE